MASNSDAILSHRLARYRERIKTEEEIADEAVDDEIYREEEQKAQKKLLTLERVAKKLQRLEKRISINSRTVVAKVFCSPDADKFAEDISNLEDASLVTNETIANITEHITEIVSKHVDEIVSKHVDEISKLNTVVATYVDEIAKLNIVVKQQNEQIQNLIASYNQIINMVVQNNK